PAATSATAALVSSRTTSCTSAIVSAGVDQVADQPIVDRRSLGRDHQDVPFLAQLGAGHGLQANACAVELDLDFAAGRQPPPTPHPPRINLRSGMHAGRPHAIEPTMSNGRHRATQRSSPADLTRTPRLATIRWATSLGRTCGRRPQPRAIEGGESMRRWAL